MTLAKSCYTLTNNFPREERYGLTMQIRRAAISVPANIAEGNGRRTRKDYVSFLRIAQGTLADYQRAMAGFGFEPIGNTPEEFGAFVKEDIARWAKLVKETGAKVE